MMGDLIRAVCFNANGLSNERKRKMLVEGCIKGRVDILGLSETHMIGEGVAGCRVGEDDGPWEGLVGGAVWAGLKDKPKAGRGKERCVILMS